MFMEKGTVGLYNMRRKDGLNVAFLELLDLEKHFVQQASSDVTGENRKHEFLPVQLSQFP
jgi:hypothetical protein